MRKNTLYNMAIPLFFIEWWFVVLATIFVVILESSIVNQYLKVGFKKIFKILLNANIKTTVLGYLVQGFFRLILGLLIFIPVSKFELNDEFLKHPIVLGLLGGVSPEKGGGFPEITLEVIITIITSVILTFTISVIFERQILIKKINLERDKRVVSKAIVIANIISYSFLTIWIFYSYSRTRF